MNITCSHCFATNRVPDQRDHTQASCGKCKNAVYSSTPIDLGNNTFYPFIEKNDLPIIVDFWATWCGPCQQMAPVFNDMAKTSSTILFAKVDTEQAQKISADANIRSIPTLIFFFRGEEVDRVSGGLSEMQMKQWIMQCVQKLAQN
ncbi:thioredoxin TrxC [Thalassotalea atypica]|uniref:thioredoxin TrxC n=1 Tax=Thalassotalea atypica TaxID=2054316 RepID=UPI0025733DCF|nr:thioredoxin TrxC [Thalassotalea atypica]